MTARADHPGEHGGAGRQQQARTVHEVTVRGLLSTTLLAALPHDISVHVVGRRVVVAEADEGQLDDLLARLTDAGFEILGVRAVPDEGPAPAGSHPAT
jgi:hypothetical protein